MLGGAEKTCLSHREKIRKGTLRDAARMNKIIKTHLFFAIIAGALSPISEIQAQEPTPTPSTPGQPGVTIEEVIVTGSNIPTAEEVGPNPVDVYSRDDIERLGVRNATDLVQKLPEAMGASI